MHWKLLLGLIYVVNGIFIGDCIPRSWIIASEIRENRKLLEEQYHVDYMVNEVMYRNWPEVQENPEHNCQRLLKKIFPKKKDLIYVTSEIQKVKLNYKQIRGTQDILTPKRVTALQCRLPIPMYNRKFYYFIRSPKSPECALFLNRIGRRSYNFYIVENVCEYREYHFIWQFIRELEEDKEATSTNVSKELKQQMLKLPDEEIKIKHYEFEQQHYKYCFINPESCYLWPEVQEMPESHCKRFLQRIISTTHDYSLITAKLHQVTLHYLEIRDENKKRFDPILVNAIACKLPHPVYDRKNISFIRAPSYPSCVFYISRKVLMTIHFYIAEEICDTPNQKTSLYAIISEHVRSSKFTKRNQLLEHETSAKLQKYERLHFHDYLFNQSNYDEWPELKEINIKSFCQTIVECIFPNISDSYNIDKLKAELEFIELKYAKKINVSDKIPSLRKVRTLKCLVSEKKPEKQLHFIRSPQPHCVYSVRQRSGKHNFYTITREICIPNPLELNFGSRDNNDDPFIIPLNDDFIHYVF